MVPRPMNTVVLDASIVSIDPGNQSGIVRSIDGLAKYDVTIESPKKMRVNVGDIVRLTGRLSGDAGLIVDDIQVLVRGE